MPLSPGCDGAQSAERDEAIASRGRADGRGVRCATPVIMAANDSTARTPFVGTPHKRDAVTVLFALTA